jgi:hypothetical protein
MLDLYEKQIESYREGYNKSVQTLSEDLFAQELYLLTKNDLPLKDQLLLRRYDNDLNRGLVAARQRKCSSAKQFFIEARKPLFMDNFPVEVKLLHQAFLEQAEAYLDYVHQDFESVYSRTYKALEIDVILEEEYGYTILLFQRIQLLHNLVRTEASRQNSKDAISLAFKILAYLDGKIETLPTPHSWGFELIARQPSELVGRMFAQVMSELALILACNPHDDLLYFHILNKYNYWNMESSEEIYLFINEKDCCHPRAHMWLLIKQAFVKKDFNTFLDLSCRFLAKGRENVPILWYSTIIDLHTLFTTIGRLDLSKKIIADAVNWNDLPKKLRIVLAKASTL